MKKRMIIFSALLMLGMSSVCSAANWQWIHSDAKYGLFFDTDSVRHVGNNRYDVWVKWCYTGATQGKKGVPENAAYARKYMELTKNNYRVMEVIYYDDNDEAIVHQKLYGKETKIRQHTYGGDIAQAVHNYIRKR